jgi:uncharacterized membrane protein YeaQ/YmgE (transglycosylase-associated protein family)
MGLISWLLAGSAIGLALALVLHRGESSRRLPSALIGMGGAFLGGTLSTALHFGGLLAFDWRSLVVAALAGLLAVLVYYLLEGRRA